MSKTKVLTTRHVLAVENLVSSNLEFDGQPFRACLMFSQDADYTEVLSSGSGSWMHEYVGSTVWDIYHEDE